MWFLLSMAALAGPLGQPIADPKVERLSLDVLAVSETAALRAEGCTGAEGCEALLEGRTWEAQLSVALLRGVGVYGELGHRAEVVQAASYEGTGHAWAVGARLALPVLRSFGVAADARFGGAESLAEPVEGALGSAGTSAWRAPRLSLVGTLGQPSDGGLGWIGVQTSPGWTTALSPLGEVDGQPLVEIDLQPRFPVSAVFGLAGVSEELGLPWRRTPRLSAGAEGWAGQTSGVCAWLGVGL